MNRNLFLPTRNGYHIILICFCLTLFSLQKVSHAQPKQTIQAFLKFQAKQDYVRRLELSPQYLILGKSRGQTDVFGLQSKGTPRKLVTSQFGADYSTVSPVGTAVATIISAPDQETMDSPVPLDQVAIWTLPQLKLKGTYKFSNRSSVCFDSQGKNLYILNNGNPSSKLVIINLSSGRQTSIKTDLLSGEVSAVSPDGNLIVSQLQDDVAIYIDLLNLKTKAHRLEDISEALVDWKVFHKTAPELLFISPHNDFVWVADTAIPIDRKLKTSKPLFKFSDAQERALLMDKKGRILSLNFKLKRLRLWDVRRKRIVAQSGLLNVKPEVKALWPPPPITLTAASSDGRFVALWQEGKLQVWRLNLPK